MHTILIYSGDTHTGFTIDGTEAAAEAWLHICELAKVVKDEVYAELWENETLIDYIPEPEHDEENWKYPEEEEEDFYKSFEPYEDEYPYDWPYYVWAETIKI